MTIHEPATLITDVLIAALAGYLGWRLWRPREGEPRRAVGLWAWAFAALALSTLSAGLWHGFAPEWPGPLARAMWKVAVLALGVASACLLAGEVVARFEGRLRRLLVALTALKFLVYVAWMTRHDEFRFAIYDYGAALLAVLGLELWAGLVHRAPSAPWVSAGILVAFLAAAIQQGGWSLHPRFNHNDLYHVVQMVSLVLVYRGGSALDH